MNEKLYQWKGNSRRSNCYGSLCYIYYTTYLNVCGGKFRREFQYFLATCADNLITARPVNQLDKWGKAWCRFGLKLSYYPEKSKSVVITNIEKHVEPIFKDTNIKVKTKSQKILRGALGKANYRQNYIKTTLNSEFLLRFALNFSFHLVLIITKHFVMFIFNRIIYHVASWNFYVYYFKSNPENNNISVLKSN